MYGDQEKYTGLEAGICYTPNQIYKNNWLHCVYRMKANRTFITQRKRLGRNVT